MGIKVLKNVNDNLQYSTTEYLGGYQYNNGVLQFFPQAQGYVKHNVNPNTTASEFDYVYQYKDHLGNIRINYTFDTATSSLRVLEENHYYPFGLKHTASLNKRDIVFEKETQEIEAPWIKGISLLGDTKKGIIVPNSGYVFRFQEQEFQDELGLNWYSYKYRNYDPANGRFMSIDPLTEEYNTWSPYTFSGNRVIDARELEGLEPHSVHNDYSSAVSNFAQYYNSYSMSAHNGAGVEVATKFYQNQNGTYSYAHPKEFTGGGADPSQINIPDGTAFLGTGHTHGNNSGQQAMTNSNNNTKVVDGLSSDKINALLKSGYEMLEGANGPSKGIPGDLNYVKNVDSKSKTFKGSFVITPSGLVYNIKLDENGNAVAKIDYNITSKTPSSGDVRVNNVDPCKLDEKDKPEQGILKLN